MVVIPPDSKVINSLSRFLNHVLQSTISVASPNSSIMSPSLFLTPYPNPPCTPSYPSAVFPTCPFKSPPIHSFFAWHCDDRLSQIFPKVFFLFLAPPTLWRIC